MYENYWQLDRSPFDSDSDPKFFFCSETHQASLLKLRYLIENRKGAGVLVGGTGIGKTYLVSALAEQLGETHGPFVHLVFPQMSPPELLAYLAVELGADPASLGSLDRTVREIERLLVQFGEHGRHPVIIIDEAHLIDDSLVFQTLRLLLNFRNQLSNFTLILAGQAEMLCEIRRNTQLEERLAVKCLLQPLSDEETVSYVSWRLQAVGASKPIFEPEAMFALFELSGGVPRRINRICDLALLVGYADETPTISAAQVEAVSEELTAVVVD